MQRTKLGGSELNVPAICLGGNVYGWTVPEAEAFRQLDAAFAAGLNFIDTADVYSRWAPGHQGGESETIIGNWMAQRGNRRQVIVATKVGMDMGGGNKGLKPGYIRQAVEDSLRRLRTDYIDLYQAHTDDAATPLVETLRAFDALVQAGKVRALGASNYGAARLAEALRISRDNGLAGYASLQPQYNLMERLDFETTLLPVVRQGGLGVIPYYALASGFLSGKYRGEADLKGRARAGSVSKYLNERGFKVLGALDAVARDHDSTPARVALAWLRAQPGVTAPIASATSLEQIADLAAAANLTLDTDSMARLSAASLPASAPASAT